MAGYAKKIVGKVKAATHIRFRSSDSESGSSRRSHSSHVPSHVSDSMSEELVGYQEPVEPTIRIRVLTDPEQIVLRSDLERQAYTAMHNRTFEHTKVFSAELLTNTGMAEEFAAAFEAVGWSNFWTINEPGSKLLTLEFLCTMSIHDSGVSFRLFNEQFFGTWAQLSQALGFDAQCSLTFPKKLISRFSRDDFWTMISAQESCQQPRTNDIHNPTLRFLHKWIAMTLHPRSDTRTVTANEMLYLFAIMKKVKVSPVRTMFEHWRTTPTRVGNIEMTSLVTRIATNLRILRNANVTYLDGHRPTIGPDHFVQGHMLRTNQDQSLVMIYRGYSTEVPLPCPQLSIYKTKKFTLTLTAGETAVRARRQPARHSVAGTGPMTRSRARRDLNLDTEEAGPSRAPPSDVPSSSRGSQGPYSAGGSGHARASYSGTYGTYGPEPGRSQSARHTSPPYYGSGEHYKDVNYIADQMGVIRENTEDILAATQQTARWTMEAAGEISGMSTRIGGLEKAVSDLFGNWNPY